MTHPSTWTDLLYALRQQECILVLGSGVSTSTSLEGTDLPLSVLLAHHLASVIERANQVVEGNRDNLFQIAGELVRHKGQTALHRETEAFYARFKTPNAIQEALAALPFHLILNASPDTLMLKALEKADKVPELIYYKPPGMGRAEAHKKIAKPTSTHPVVYNMLGCCVEPSSLVLTESEQLDYLQDVIRHSDAIPNTLLEVCKVEKSVFLFIGFDFEHWQLRLLLRALKLDGAEQIVHWAVQRPASLQKDTLLFFKDQYGLHFLDTDTASFVRELAQYHHQNTLAPEPEPDLKLRAVCLYAPEDEAYRRALDAHLAPLREHQHMDTWSDALIRAGEVIEEVTQKAIDEAHLIIVLASADFVASEDLYRVQLTRALGRLRQGAAKIFVVLVRRFAWEDTLFAQCKLILPHEGGEVKPVAEWAQPDAAWTEVVNLILRHTNYLLEDLHNPVAP